MCVVVVVVVVIVVVVVVVVVVVAVVVEAGLYITWADFDVNVGLFQTSLNGNIA